ncbi:MAG TPA: efflux RND transporter periplasmic adaptor subunit [Thermoanaerobaculia bacterium]
MKCSLLIAAALFAIACGRKETPPTPAPVVNVDRASVATVRMARVTNGPRLSGTLQPQQSATILAETGGTITAVNAAEGQYVTRGSVLAVISDETAATNAQGARTSVQSAETAVLTARRDLQRAQTLASAGAVPRRDVDVARSQVAAAESQLAQARTQLAQARERVGDQRVEASLNGVISQKQVSTGTVVTPGAPLFTLVDLGTLQLEASVSAEALSAIQPGSSVDVEVRGYPKERFRGNVTRISPAVDPATGQVKVFVVIGNQGRKLVGGLFAEGTVTTVARMSLVVPISAIDDTTSAAAVVRINNGVTERVPVTLGVRNEAEGVVEVTGVREGDRVLAGPARTIAPGTKVAVR